MKRNNKNNNDVILIVKLSKEDQVFYGTISLEQGRYITEFQKGFKAQVHRTFEQARNAMVNHIQKKYKNYTIEASGVILDE